MTHSEPVMYPCPRCGNGRDEIEAACLQCDWNPNARATPQPKEKPKPTSVSQPYGVASAAAIGLLTLLPIVYVVCFFWTVAMNLTTPENVRFAVLIPAHILGVALGVILLGFYIYYLFSTDHVAESQKGIWLIAILGGGHVAMLVFWFLHIWSPTARSRGWVE